MKTNKVSMYSMYDRKSHQYSQPFLQTNDSTASRYFNYMCSLEANVMIANDLELYKLATFDFDSGEIVPENKPVFLCNAGEEIKEVIRHDE